MPATSEAQQRLFGAVLGYKRGKKGQVSDKIKKIAKSVTGGQAAEFAESVKKNPMASAMNARRTKN